MSLKLNIVRSLDVTVMELAGRVTLGEACEAFRDAVLSALWNGHRKLALDYGDISYQDSSGTGEMVYASTIVSNSGGELVIFDLTKRVHDLLQITKLYTVFNDFDSRESALAYFDESRNPEIQVSENHYLHVAVLGIEGTLSEKFGASRVPSAVTTALNAGAKSVILLCPQVLDIDLSGADSLRQAMSNVQERGGKLVLAGVEERLIPAMSETGIASDIPAYDTIDAALGIFGLKAGRSRGRIEVVRAD
jgi:anti-sigma B factor antagonist